MKLSEGIQQKLDQEKVSEAEARKFFKDLQTKDAINKDVNFDDPGVREATMLYLLKDSLTEGARTAQLEEVGLNSLEIRRKFFEITSANEIFEEIFGNN